MNFVVLLRMINKNIIFAALKNMIKKNERN